MYLTALNSAVPPRFIKRPEDKVANENQDLEFECEIYGKPDPKVTWLKNGERITLSQYWQLVNRYAKCLVTLNYNYNTFYIMTYNYNKIKDNGIIIMYFSL